MKSTIAAMVEAAGVEPVNGNRNDRTRNHLQPCKPRRANSVLILAFALTALAAPAFAQERASLKLPAIVFVLSQAADWHSTQLALSNGTGREGNPLMQVGTGGQAAIKVGTSIAIVYVAHRLNRQHPRAAKAVLWIGSAATFSIASLNYRIALK